MTESTGSTRQVAQARRHLRRAWVMTCAWITVGLSLGACNDWPFVPPPTATPMPTRTPVPSRTPRPTWTPAPSRTPRPTATAHPTGTPRATARPVVVTVIVTVTGSPERQNPIRQRRAPSGDVWFFSPHPAETLRNPLRYAASYQAYERGGALYLREKGQTFVFAAPTGRASMSTSSWVWTNRAGDLDSVANALDLGAALGERAQWTACAGDTFVDGVVGAFVLMPDMRVLTWRIRVADHAALGWGILDPDRVTGCDAYRIAAEARP